LVVAGFGRGSKQLGIPTGKIINCKVIAYTYTTLANYPEDVVGSLPDAIQSGIYYGWAMVDQGPVYKMVMSIGWNPVYQNDKRSMVSANDVLFDVITRNRRLTSFTSSLMTSMVAN